MSARRGFPAGPVTLVTLAAFVALVALAWSFTGGAVAAVQPDPGNAAARACGLALLADAPGPLTLFDQPARLAPAAPARFALAAARTQPFGLDALTRTRLAATVTRRTAAAALGLESYGPPGARRTRLVAGLAWRGAHADGELALGAAWQEARVDGSGAEGAPGAVRAGALDAGATFERGAVTAAFAARTLASGGAVRAQPDPDWTLEARIELGVARLHGALTHDLAGTRPGGGIAFAVGPCVLQAGAFGPPWGGAVGVELGARHLRCAAARMHHPELGPSDAWDAEVAW